ncbi:MAG: RNA 2'-phosphotransferase [Bacteroidia bacterium]
MNVEKRYRQLSKFLSLVLRHRPDHIGLELDAQGWVAMPVLLESLTKTKLNTDKEELLGMIAANDKQRFTYDAEQDRIRAAQGHTVNVALDYNPAVPPSQLYHGTVARFVGSIKSQGLKPGKRNHVHLSPDLETATKVGSRRGEAVILIVDAAAMHREGGVFYESENGVWLTKHVPSIYIQFP